ncbi:TlpA family protein disulfide reductase [Fulvivirga maritima]|uniref:TlpA family protein disulfide reductase n=1 Tax=Fulvivirga maritima TaxID=2904247 RepID=UPI001F1EAD00|nr:TlpA disulfide reductase family protein [Fulvivirga maritima]UII25627.1 TlpA family protein disulfide reductase [Fulvivirga maritima]
MIRSTYSLPLLLLLAVLITSCNHEPPPPKIAHISGKFIGAKDTVKLYVRDYGQEIHYSHPIYLDTISSDEKGLFSFELPLEKGKEIAIESNFDFNKFFIEPGDSIYFETDKDYRTPIQNIAGIGSEKLEMQTLLKNQLSFLELKEIDSADILPEYKKRLEIYQQTLDSAKSKYSDAFYTYLKANFLHENHYFQSMFSGYMKALMHIDFPKDSIAEQKSTEELLAYASKGEGNFSFSHQVMYLIMKKAYETNKEDVTKQIAYYKQAIDSLDLAPHFEQVMLGKGYLYFLERGNVSELETPLDNYYTTYPKSDYNETLKEEYNGWLAIADGQPAPNLEGTTQDDQVFHLADLNGKVVYIDIWATWCAPCREEIPYSQDIKEHYKDNDDIAFLYVSVDQSKKSWLDYLKSHPDFKGIHINDPGNFQSNIAEAFKVSGIPRYIIIDKEGKIFATDAKRPSSGDNLIEQLDAALAETKA